MSLTPEVVRDIVIELGMSILDSQFAILPYTPAVPTWKLTLE